MISSAFIIMIFVHYNLFTITGNLENFVSFFRSEKWVV